MIVLGKMLWGNLFSYGDNNEIDFSSTPIVQILGYNGFGKSSIALILEEVLFNKNSKNIKKADILNRYIKSKTYWITLYFVKNEDSYCIETIRGSTQTVVFTKNGTDISAHTATATYKLIFEVLGYDHKSFTQIIYQSSISSLEFLTATDGARKKFLIDLLDLGKYVEASEIFKASTKELNDKIIEVTSKISTYQSWIDNYSNFDFKLKLIYEIPEAPRLLIEEVTTLKASIIALDSYNKKIIQNNKYKELRDNIDLEVLPTKPSENIELLKSNKAVAQKELQNTLALISKISTTDVCHACKQPIDNSKNKILLAEQLSKKTDFERSIKGISEQILNAENTLSIWKQKELKVSQYENYSALYDAELPTILQSKEELEKKIVDTEKLITDVNSVIKDLTAKNTLAQANNAKVSVVQNQLLEMKEGLHINSEKLKELNSRYSIFQILVKTFSPTGLIAYKIECLIKDLEEAINVYLIDISSGRFQLNFKVEADKLNVIITDNGFNVDIVALSTGERARVNFATLLGIRKLLQSLSGSRVNLLILDETIENFDAEGKEKAIEILCSETYLNTFIISHGFSHPLLEKIQITKTNNISRIE